MGESSSLDGGEARSLHSLTSRTVKKKGRNFEGRWASFAFKRSLYFLDGSLTKT